MSSGTPGPWDVPLKEAAGGGRPLAAIDKGEALAPAHALDKFGHELSAVGSQWLDEAKKKEDERRKWYANWDVQDAAASVTDARIQAFKGLAEIERGLREDPDYKTHVDKFNDQAAKLKEQLLPTIPDEDKRRAFGAQFEMDALHMGARIESGARTQDVNVERSRLQRQIGDARELLSAPGLLDPSQEAQIKLQIGQSIAGMAARPGYLSEDEGKHLWAGFQENAETDKAMQYAAAGDFESARGIAETSPYIPNEKKPLLQQHVNTMQQKVVAANAAQVKQQMADDIRQVRTGGLSSQPVNLDKVRQYLGQDEAEKYVHDRMTSGLKFQISQDFDALPAEEMKAKIKEWEPKQNDPQAATKKEVQDFATQYADKVLTLRAQDPASAVGNVNYVQDAVKSGNATDVIRARMRAQDAVGVPENLRSPITKAEGLRITSRFEGLKGQPLLDAMRDTIKGLEGQFGEYAPAVFRNAISFKVTSEEGARQTRDMGYANVAASVAEKMAMGGTPTASETNIIDSHANQMSASRAFGDPGADAGQGMAAKDYPKPSSEAVQMLLKNPSLAPQFDAHYRKKGLAARIIMQGVGEDTKSDVELPGGPQGGAAGELGKGVPDSLFSRVISAESDGNPNEVGPLRNGDHARGSAQIMGYTGSSPGYGVTPLRDKSDAENRRFGKDYLGAMLKEFGGDQEAALIAYNAGPANAQKWLAAGRDYHSLPRPGETHAYVKKVLGKTS
jgi:hypothetical protein